MSEWLPINPPVNTKAIHDREIMNQELSVRDRQAARRVFIPAVEEEEVEVKPAPFKRRHFVDPNAIGGRPTRRID